MATSIVLLIIAGCAAYQYFKGTVVKAVPTVIITLLSGFVAFSFFEVLANVFISRSANSRYPAMVPWAQPLALMLLFVLVFAILQALASQLMRKSTDLSELGERIGRVVCGVFIGLIVSGLVMTALDIAPLPDKYPYQRFDSHNPNPEKPNKVFPDVDGFVTGWFSLVSRGSLSGKRSFGVIHPCFVSQSFLNRHNVGDDISIITSTNAIEVPRKNAAWLAPDNLKDTNGNPVLVKSGHNLIMVRVGIKRAALKDARAFTPSQLRLACNNKGCAERPLAGKGINVYPAGYIAEANQLQLTKLDKPIKIDSASFKTSVRWLDFAFYVPSDYVPVIVAFKQNSIAQIAKLVGADNAPTPEPFIQR